MTKMDELKPCPFCGGEATLNHGATGDFDVSCRNRKCFGPRTSSYAFMSDAIAAWNRRPSLSPAGVTEEEVEAAAREISPHLWVELTHEQRMSDDYAFTNRRDAQERARKQARAALEAAAKAQPSAAF